MHFLHVNLEEAKLQWQKVDLWFPGIRDGKKEMVDEAKGHKGTSWGERNVLYHDHTGGYMTAYIYQHSLNFALKIGEFFKVNYTSINWWKYKKKESGEIKKS